MPRSIGRSRFEHYGKPTRERNLAFALKFMRRTASALGLTRLCLYRSIEICKKASSMGIVKGRKIEKVCCACLYYSCKELGIPCSIHEIAGIVGVDPREAMRSYVSLSRKLGLRIRPSDARTMIPRFCSVLKLPASMETKALEMIRNTDGMYCGPRTLAAAAIYLASDKKQKEIAKVLAVSEVSLRSTAKKLKCFAGE
ncbi:MAG: hypothetical protein ACE5J7_01280 [Candidatus Aenigmatarchaeota archaeon]